MVTDRAALASPRSIGGQNGLENGRVFAGKTQQPRGPGPPKSHTSQDTLRPRAVRGRVAIGAREHKIARQNKPKTTIFGRYFLILDFSSPPIAPVGKNLAKRPYAARQTASGEDAPQICGRQPSSSRALHSAARSDRTAAPTPPSVLFGGGAVRDHAELSARAAVGGWAPHNRHLLNTPNAACAKQQQCCARESRSTPARAGAARRPSCTATAAPRASA